MVYVVVGAGRRDSRGVVEAANVAKYFAGCGVGVRATAARVPPLHRVDAWDFLHVHAELDLPGFPGGEDTPYPVVLCEPFVGGLLGGETSVDHGTRVDNVCVELILDELLQEGAGNVGRHEVSNHLSAIEIGKAGETC